MPAGFLGTRGNLLMDTVVVAIVLTPFLFLWAVRLAKRGRYTQHRNFQTGLLGVLLVVVILFEVDVRLSGGTEGFLAGSPYLGTPLLKWLLRIHVVVAVATTLLWLAIAVQAWRARMDLNPLAFSAAHRRRGYWVFAGVIFTAVSGVWLYWLGFVA